MRGNRGAFPLGQGNEVELSTQAVSINLPAVAFMKEKCNQRVFVVLLGDCADFPYMMGSPMPNVGSFFFFF